MHYMCLDFPEKVLTLPDKMTLAFMKLLEMGLTKYGCYHYVNINVLLPNPLLAIMGIQSSIKTKTTWLCSKSAISIPPYRDHLPIKTTLCGPEVVAVGMLHCRSHSEPSTILATSLSNT